MQADAAVESRGFDFAFAARVFDGDTLQRDDQCRDNGERRVIAVGEVDGLVLVVVYTWRGNRPRIISARWANRRERGAYRRAFSASEKVPSPPTG